MTSKRNTSRRAWRGSLQINILNKVSKVLWLGSWKPLAAVGSSCLSVIYMVHIILCYSEKARCENPNTCRWHLCRWNIDSWVKAHNQAFNIRQSMSLKQQQSLSNTICICCCLFLWVCVRVMWRVARVFNIWVNVCVRVCACVRIKWQEFFLPMSYSSWHTGIYRSAECNGRKFNTFLSSTQV